MGDPILERNLTRRVDFALFMVEALENDELIHDRQSSADRRPRRSPMPSTAELSSMRRGVLGEDRRPGAGFGPAVVGMSN